MREARISFTKRAGLVAGCSLLFVFSGQEAALGQGWRATFSGESNIKSAGEYQGGRGEPRMYFESFSPLCLEPSSTATFAVVKRSRRSLAPEGSASQVTFRDTRPALKPNPSGTPFYTRAEGTISALAWVDQKFANVKVTGEVNTTGGPDGKGSTSRQGLIARWDQGNNYYWFYVNFSTGTYGIVRSRFFGVLADDLKGSSGAVRDFRNTKGYFLEFELTGNTAQGKVYDQDASGARRLVGDTGKITDTDSFPGGVSGVLVELWKETPFAPLEGSFANLTSTPIR